ncbi:hypothetical protein FJZ19_02730 [Candidatus Pacearchaeota archaeon]|nr:hypothetical protein [Candidatus Pacearchaeota archaeon]
MTVESIFKKSWEEFTKNIVLSLKVSWWYFIFPLLILALIVVSLFAGIIASIKPAQFYSAQFYSTPDFNMSTGITGNVVNDSAQYTAIGFLIIIIIIISAIVFFLVIYFTQLVILCMTIFNEKGGMKRKEASKKARDNFWIFLGLTLLIMVILSLLFGVPMLLGILSLVAFSKLLILGIPLFIIFLIGGIILAGFFGVKFSLSPYILLKEDTKITEAIRRSSALVTGRWWKTFGCILLFSMISWALSFVASMIMQVLYFFFLAFMFFAIYLGVVGIAIIIFIFVGIIIAIYGLMTGVTSLVMFLLMKNLYLDYKK